MLQQLPTDPKHQALWGLLGAGIGILVLRNLWLWLGWNRIGFILLGAGVVGLVAIAKSKGEK